MTRELCKFFQGQIPNIQLTSQDSKVKITMSKNNWAGSVAGAAKT